MRVLLEENSIGSVKEGAITEFSRPPQTMCFCISEIACRESPILSSVVFERSPSCFAVASACANKELSEEVPYADAIGGAHL